MTKGEIDRLGQRIQSSKDVSIEDLNMLQEYRQSFQEAVASVFSFVLEVARKIDKQCIVTFRIKRIDTIVKKLKRFEENSYGRMALSRMWDIAGCRCILYAPQDEKLYSLLEKIREEYGPDCKVNDYVISPKSSGYRSIHVYVKDKQSQKPIEIQIRNRNQHNWATLVEIVDLFYETQIKEFGATSSLGRFLYLYSSASSLSDNDFSEMLKTERKMKVFERMSLVLTGNYLHIRRQWITQTRGGNNYFVIIANKKGSQIFSYPSFKEAESAYYSMYLANDDSNIVLTHLSSPIFEQISMAYSNYMLAMHAFFDDYRIMVSKKIIECIRYAEYYKFIKYFRIYTSNVKCHIENLSIEAKDVEICYRDPSISKGQIRKWAREIENRFYHWVNETQDFLTIIKRASYGSLFKRMLVDYQVNRLIKAIKQGQRVL